MNKGGWWKKTLQYVGTVPWKSPMRMAVHQAWRHIWITLVFRSGTGWRHNNTTHLEPYFRMSQGQSSWCFLEVFRVLPQKNTRHTEWYILNKTSPQAAKKLSIWSASQWVWCSTDCLFLLACEFSWEPLTEPEADSTDWKYNHTHTKYWATKPPVAHSCSVLFCCHSLMLSLLRKHLVQSVSK